MTTTAEIAFPSPQEIEGYWDWDKIHAPRPLTPLAGDAVVMSMGEGFTIAQHAFGSPLALHCTPASASATVFVKSHAASVASAAR